MKVVNEGGKTLIRVLKRQLILSESQKYVCDTVVLKGALHVVYFGLQKHLNGQYFISSRFR